MWFKHRAWIPVAWALSVVNLGAVWFAAQPAEPWHATAHALLAVAFALGARRLTERRRSEGPRERWPQAVDQTGELQQTLEQNAVLQQTIEGLQPRLQELEERLDFAERLLAQHRDAERRGEPPR